MDRPTSKGSCDGAYPNPNRCSRKTPRRVEVNFAGAFTSATDPLPRTAARSTVPAPDDSQRRQAHDSKFRRSGRHAVRMASVYGVSPRFS